MRCSSRGRSGAWSAAWFRGGQHRLRWREHDKERLLVVANRQAIAGSVLLALAMSGATFLVTDVLFEVTSAAIVTGFVAALFTWLWFGWPLLRQARDQD